MNLHEKICMIMHEVKNIPKKGYNSFHNYNYMREADIVDAVRDLLAKHKVCIISSVLEVMETIFKGKDYDERLIRIKVQYDIIDAEKPADKITSIHYGEAIDSRDKAYYKASTSCHKYFLIRNVFLGSDDDVEKEKDIADGILPKQTSVPSSKYLGAATPIPPSQIQDEWSKWKYSYSIPFKLFTPEIKESFKQNKMRFNGVNKHWYGNHLFENLKQFLVIGAPTKDKEQEVLPLKSELKDNDDIPEFLSTPEEEEVPNV